MRMSTTPQATCRRGKVAHSCGSSTANTGTFSGERTLRFSQVSGSLRMAEALVSDPAAGIVEAPIGREPGSVLRRMVTPDGAFARTRYEVVQTGRGRSLVQLKLDTGRTHQIRVHMAHLGCPLVGDFLYGRETEELPDRFALHSASIRLEQPVTGREIVLEAPLPRELADLLT